MGNINAEGTTSKFSYLDMLASIGFAKHIGGSKATDIFIERSGINSGSYVLDVGCGLGRTSCRLAKEFGCKVVGIDIMPRMIEASWARAKELGVEDMVTFINGDARVLPFEKETFDVILVESVTIFLDDIEKAIAGYEKVLKTGGVLCDNEVCITRKSREELKDRVEDLDAVFSAFSSRTSRGVLTFEDWKEIFESRFGSVDAAHYIIDPAEENTAALENGLDALISQLKAMWLYMTNPDARRMIDTGRKVMSFADHFGYGLFICKK